MGKRDDLAQAATDHALEHGLIGLSLRPLAAAIGTSDRMLIYHFGSKDQLVDAVLDISNERSIEVIRSRPPAASVAEAITALWDVFTSGQLQRCQRMYVEAAALGLFGREPYATSVRESNIAWLDVIASHLRASGAAETAAPRLAALVDATFNGLLLDGPLDDAASARAVVEDLASAVAG